MKLLTILTLFGGLLFTSLAYGQSATQQAPKKVSAPGISELTRVMLLKDGNTEADIQELVEQHPDEAAATDYYYSKSFKVKEGQIYSNEQYLLIDITQLDQSRLTNEITEVVDNASHLHLILDAHNTVITTSQYLRYPNGAPDYTQKYQNQ